LLLEQILPNCALHSHDVVNDARGSLVALEGASNVPFEIERVYFLYGTAHGAERGFHAHRELEQWVVAVAGSCVITVDDASHRQEVELDAPDKALYIGPGIWREMRDFSSGAVLMVLASKPYDEADYIRDYDEFQLIAQRGLR
jgi:dTDP-4-dehydrorhamnose 3,5-epimerase-like enzyme